MNLDATTRGGIAATSRLEPQARAASLDSDIRNILGCELAAEVIRSSGSLGLRALGASMLPSIWPGDVLTVSSKAVAETQPGDIILFEREGRLIAHRVVEVTETKSEVRSPRSDVHIRDSRFKIQNSKFDIPNAESRVPSPEPRLEFITRGDSVAGNDSPVSHHEILGRVTSIQRGSRQVSLQQSTFSRIVSWILSRSDFATRVLLKVGGLMMGIRNPGFRIVESVPRIQDLA